jgi:hypothetical protein
MMAQAVSKVTSASVAGAEVSDDEAAAAPPQAAGADGIALAAIEVAGGIAPAHAASRGVASQPANRREARKKGMTFMIMPSDTVG